MDGACLPELAATTKLERCTVGDLRRVLASVYVYSLFVTRLEDASENQRDSGLVLEPRVVSGSQNEMTHWLACLSGVAEASVERDYFDAHI